MGDDQMSGLLEWSTQIVEESSDSVELWKSLSLASRALDFRGFCGESSTWFFSPSSLSLS